MEEEQELAVTATHVLRNTNDSLNRELDESQYSQSGEGSLVDEAKMSSGKSRKATHSPCHNEGQEELAPRTDAMEVTMNLLLKRQETLENIIGQFLQRHDTMATTMEKLQGQMITFQTARRIENPGESLRFMASDRVDPDTASGYPWLRLEETECKIPSGDPKYMKRNIRGLSFWNY